jgi:hypothetical protein
LSFNHRNCILFRHGEKEILHFLIKFGDLCISLLGEKFKDAKKICQGLPESYENQRDYLQNVLLKIVASDNQA